MAGHRLTNEEVRRRAGVESITRKAEEARMRWFGHIIRMDENKMVKRAWNEPVRGRRSRGRQRIRWRDGVESRMRELGLTEEDANNREKWRSGP